MSSHTFTQSAPIAIPAPPNDYNNTSFSIASSPDTNVSNLSCGSSICGLSTAATSVDDLLLDNKDDINPRAFNNATLQLDELDIALENELQDEHVPVTVHTAATKITSPDPYQKWECSFGFTGRLEAPAAIPETKTKFLDAINSEITTVGFIQSGFTSYIKAINSGEHHAFSDDFLKNQNDATHKTIGQLFQIASNLRDVVKKVEGLDLSEVSSEFVEAFAHAQPWIQRTRAILVSAHVFYKINYVLGSDKKSHFG